MDDYIEKMQELLLLGYSNNEVAENLYLNYHSVIKTDEVYRLRKALAIQYQCDLNDVKLIGSSHTGYAYKEGTLQKRNNPQDYDFAIISANVFVRFFHMVNKAKIFGKQKNLFVKGIFNGKLHPRYADNEFQQMVKEMNHSVMDSLKVSKPISVCFYLSERDFVDGLVKYNSTLYSGELKRISEKKNNEDLKMDEVGELQNLTGIIAVDKMEG